MPLFTTAQVQSAITSVSTATQGGEYLEVFTSYFSNPLTVSEGIYIARVYQADRVKSSNGIRPGGHIYSVKDRVEMYLISSQDNPFVENLLAIFPTTLDNTLFQGYHLREHTIDQVYANNHERYRIIFDLTRTQVI